MPLYWGWRALGPLAAALPAPLAYAAARALMRLVFLAWPRGRRAIRENVRVVLDDQTPAREAAADQLASYGEYLVDTLRLDAIDTAACYRALKVAPGTWERLRAWHGTRPILFAVMHLGNWDILGGAYMHACGRSQVLVEPLGHPKLDAYVFGQRDRIGMTPLMAPRGARVALRALRHNGTLAILFDTPLAPGAPGLDLHFCGARCRLPAGMARLALAAGAKVIPLACVRTRRGAFAFRALLDLDFEYAVSGDREADARALTQAVLDVFEPWVRAHPEQWYQFRPFFQEAARA